MRPTRLLLGLLALTVAGRSWAQPYGAPASPYPERQALFILGTGYDQGFTRLTAVRFTDGSTRTLFANQGFYIAAGVGFLPFRAGMVKLDTAATLGVKRWDIGAHNGKVRYLAFPLDVVERLWLDQVRFGLGFSLVLAPHISSSGVLSGIDYDMKDSLGLLAQAEWIGARRSGAGVMLGVRFLWHRFVGERTGAINANAAGLSLGLEL